MAAAGARPRVAVRQATAQRTIAPPTTDSARGASPSRRNTQHGFAIGSIMPMSDARVAGTWRRPRRKSTYGASTRNQTTPLYWRKIALAADVHLVATTNVVRQPA